MPKPIKRVSTAPSGATSSSSGYGYGQAKSSGYGQPPPQTPQGVALAPHVQNTKENVRGSSINANHNNNPLLNESISMASMSGLEKLPVSDRKLNTVCVTFMFMFMFRALALSLYMLS